MNRATGFELPVEDRYMRRLRMYRNQVLPISTPTCPSGWSRHTKNPQKAIDDFGVAWVDADNYFCGPPGSDESTLYREDDPEYSSPGALTKRIHELTNDIKYAMEPEKYKDTIDKRNKTKEMRKEAFERSKKMRHEAVTKEHESMRNRNEAKIAEIYKEHEFLDPAAAKQKASALYEVAFRCVKNPNSSENKNGCREVVDNTNPLKPKTYYVPRDLYVNDDDMPDPVTLKLLEWWRTYRRTQAAKHLVDERKNLSLYV